MQEIPEIQSIRIDRFDYPLPQERIALHPVADREGCKLLVHKPDGELIHDQFSNLPRLLPEKGLMICNNTKVINARMKFRKPTGAVIEIFLLEPDSPSEYVEMFGSEGPVVWNCLVGNSKKWKEGLLTLEIEYEQKVITLLAERAGEGKVRFSWKPAFPFATIVELAGKIPIPPYLNRETEAADSADYQTVYSRVSGSVAAPTAGLHFTPSLLERLKADGTEVAEVSLHVGAGTFQPVKSEEIGDHPMHTEHFTITLPFIKTLIEALRDGKKITAVGTTSVRTIESLPYIGRKLKEGRPPHVKQWEAYLSENQDMDTLSMLQQIRDTMKSRGEEFLNCSTAIMIAPGFRWRITDVLITNFHQPESTLLLLVESFLDRNTPERETWRSIYQEALKRDYRFLSYGDACLFYPNES